MKICFWLICILPLVSACSVGPDYIRPDVQISDEFKEVPKGWKIAKPNDEQDRGQWWLVFKNPQLNNLEQATNVANLNIAIVESQYRQARVLVAEAVAGYCPTLTGNAGTTRQKTSSAVSNNTNLASLDTLGLTISWELDIWGQVRRNVEANKAGLDASKAQLAATKLSVQGLLAQSYFQLNTADRTQKLLDDTVKEHKKSLAIMENCYKSGTVSQLEVIQAQTQLQDATTQAIDNGINRAQLEHAIAILLGKSPALFKLPKRSFNIKIPNIPLKVPSYLLERRPDIAAAERRVAEANAQIGVARAAFYPTLTLSGTNGYTNNNFSHLITKPTQYWSLGSQITQLLFDGGKQSAIKQAAVENFNQSIATYKQTVLSAFQNVEDNLVVLKHLQLEATTQKAVINQAEQALLIVNNQYQAGTVAHSSVIMAQIAVFNAKLTAINIEGRQILAAVGLIMALGGGWEGL